MPQIEDEQGVGNGRSIELHQTDLRVLNPLVIERDVAEQKTQVTPVAKTGKTLMRIARRKIANPKTQRQVKRVGGGSIEYFEVWDENTRSWRLAVYYDDIRGVLNEEASRSCKLY